MRETTVEVPELAIFPIFYASEYLSPIDVSRFSILGSQPSQYQPLIVYTTWK